MSHVQVAAENHRCLCRSGTRPAPESLQPIVFDGLPFRTRRAGGQVNAGHLQGANLRFDDAAFEVLVGFGESSIQQPNRSSGPNRCAGIAWPFGGVPDDMPSVGLLKLRRKLFRQCPDLLKQQDIGLDGIKVSLKALADRSAHSVDVPCCDPHEFLFSVEWVVWEVFSFYHFRSFAVALPICRSK